MNSQRGTVSRIVCASLAALLVAVPAAAQKVIADYPPNTNPASGDLLLLQPAGSRTNPYNNLTLQALWQKGISGGLCSGSSANIMLNQAGQPMLNQAGQPMLVSGGGSSGCTPWVGMSGGFTGGSVPNATSFGSTVSMAGLTTLSGGLQSTQGIFGSGLIVSGGINTDTLSATGALTLTGNTTFTGTLTAQSTSTFVGTLTSSAATVSPKFESAAGANLIISPGGSGHTITFGDTSYGIGTMGTMTFNSSGASILNFSGNVVFSGTLTSGSSVGVTCFGAPTSSFASTNGVVTHC